LDNQFIPIKYDDIVLEDYSSSDEPSFRPNSPDYPPPDYEEEKVILQEQKPIKSWAEIVASKK
jgi:hypothetical protein